MKIARFVGRLGNQMFIYAFAKAVEYYTGEKVYFDDCSDDLQLDKIFNLKFDIIPSNKLPLKYMEFRRIPFIAGHKKNIQIFITAEK